MALQQTCMPHGDPLNHVAESYLCAWPSPSGTHPDTWVHQSDGPLSLWQIAGGRETYRPHWTLVLLLFLCHVPAEMKRDPFFLFPVLFFHSQSCPLCTDWWINGLGFALFLTWHQRESNTMWFSFPRSLHSAQFVSTLFLTYCKHKHSYFK